MSSESTLLVWVRTYDDINQLFLPLSPAYFRQSVFRCLFQFSIKGFPGGSVVKNLPANAGDAGDEGLIPGLGRCPGRGNGNPLQYCCLKNPMDRETWWAMIHGVTKSQTQLSDWVHSLSNYYSEDECVPWAEEMWLSGPNWYSILLTEVNTMIIRKLIHQGLHTKYIRPFIGGAPLSIYRKNNPPSSE